MMVILGGMGSLFGPILGAIAFVGVEEIFKERDLTGTLADHWQILMGSFIILVVLTMKGGLAGWIVRLTTRPRRGGEAADG